MFRLAFRFISLLLVLLTTTSTQAAEEGYLAPLNGWHILREDFNPDHPLDIVAFEWEYFMIHDARFRGIVGYVVANPREKLGDLIQIVPNGANVAVVGEFTRQTPVERHCILWFCWQTGGETVLTRPIADYLNFGTRTASYSATERTFYGDDDQGRFGRITPLYAGGPNGEDALHLEGQSDHFAWDLVIYQGMKDRDAHRTGSNAPFTVSTGHDVGLLPGESWTVDAIWPRTRVVGTITDRITGETVPIDGKGYRENSWGRYLLSIDGWDFMVFSEEDENGVLMAMQTYHRSEQLDFVDVSFYDNGTLVSQRFTTRNNQMHWHHPDWYWDAETHACVPENTRITLSNDQYTIEARIDIDSRQRPLLSDATIGTTIFFIQEHFPTVTGTITRTGSGEIVRTFTGQAGGEFAFHKDPAPWHSDLYCTLQGQVSFRH